MTPFSLLAPMTVVAAVVVVMFGLSLVTFTGVAFAKPERAERFLLAFASSARTHYVEQVVRIVIGTALVGVSSTMWQPKAFWVFGWVLVISSTALLCIPWQWHDRLGKRVRPMLVRYLKVYAVGAFALGVLLLYGIYAGSGPA
jgi:hypothetical protein